MSEDIQLFRADCFDIFPKLKDKSIDLVIVDLPYGITACKWDSLIDLDEMWKHLKRICKKKCIYVFFCTTKFGVSIINSNPKWFKYDLIWMKSKKVGFLSANKMPLRKHELLYVFGNNSGGKKTYNPQKVPGKPYKHSGRLSTGIYEARGSKLNKPSENKSGDRHPDSILQYEESKNVKIRGGKYNDSPYGDFKNTKSIPSDKKHPSTILKFNNPKKSLHRTQKPVDLLEWLIRSYSNEGDLVMDFTAGSGSTGIACINTKRKCICIEKDDTIYKIMEKRINDSLHK
jgi:site-specific DNA-methyltransferase (adenine-specific)